MINKKIAKTILATVISMQILTAPANVCHAHSITHITSYTQQSCRLKKEYPICQGKYIYNITLVNDIIRLRVNKTLADMTKELAKQKVSQKNYKNNTFVDATNLEIAQHLMVEPRLNNDYFKYQFLKINIYRDIDVNALNYFLQDKGVFKNHAIDFVNAAKLYNIDPIYLVSHALLETGNGTSNLAKGTVIDGVRYYNFFGINAFDNSPLYSGSSLAKKEKWTSVSAAIYGGAKWISANYLHSTKFNQNTLYKMKFNPHAKNPWHIYATDIKWPDKISTNMHNLIFLYADKENLIFEIPDYSK